MSLAPVDFEYLQKLVMRHSAIVIDAGKEYLAETRLASLVQEHGCSTLPEFLQRLRAESFGGMHRKVLDAMTNTETCFFRDCGPFAALENHVFPDLMKRREGERKLSLWSAACSSGQEPYSVAILLRENSALRTWTLTIRATDFSDRVLEQARAGIYRQMEVNRGLPARYLTKYFTNAGLKWQLKPEITEMVTFQQMNLSDAWPELPRFDVVFLRNVLIYFSLETRRQILARMLRVLRPDGYLFLGSAESILGTDSGFRRVQLDKVVCYQTQPKVIP